MVTPTIRDGGGESRWTWNWTGSSSSSSSATTPAWGTTTMTTTVARGGRSTRRSRPSPSPYCARLQASDLEGPATTASEGRVQRASRGSSKDNDDDKAGGGRMAASSLSARRRRQSRGVGADSGCRPRTTGASALCRVGAELVVDATPWAEARASPPSPTPPSPPPSLDNGGMGGSWTIPLAEKCGPDPECRGDADVASADGIVDEANTNTTTTAISLPSPPLPPRGGRRGSL